MRKAEAGTVRQINVLACAIEFKAEEALAVWRPSHKILRGGNVDIRGGDPGTAKSPAAVSSFCGSDQDLQCRKHYRISRNRARKWKQQVEAMYGKEKPAPKKK